MPAATFDEIDHMRQRLRSTLLDLPTLDATPPGLARAVETIGDGLYLLLQDAADRAKAPSPHPPSVEDFAVAEWNHIASTHGWLHPATLAEMTDEQRALLRQRIGSVGGSLGWMRIMLEVRKSDLWMGRAGDRWRPTIADLLDPDKFGALKRGEYRSKPWTTHATGPFAGLESLRRTGGPDDAA